MIVRLLTGVFVPPESGQQNDQTSLEQLDKPALLVYAGKFDSMDGPVEVTAEHLTKLVENHNAKVSHLSGGSGAESHKDYPPIQLDHSTSARDTVGRLVGPIRIGDFNGQPAIYGTARFLGKENVERVKDGRWTHLSVGADFESGTLEELTVTPFPAAPNASLLSKDIKKPVEGTIVKVTTMGGLDTYTLDSGFQWSDSPGRHQKGDRVRVSPYIMGTVRVEKLSKGDKMTDEQKERLRKHLMESTKCSKEEADEKVSKMSKEDADAELSRLAAEDKEESDKLAAEKKDEDDKKLARKTDFVKMARGFRQESKSVTLAASKVKLSAKLSKLRAEAKITPAELKAIDLDKMCKLSKEAQEAVLDSYEKRQPVIIPGQMSAGSSGTEISHLAASAEDKEFLKDMEGSMRFSKGAVKKLADGGNGPTSMDGQAMQLEAFPTSMDNSQQMSKHLEHLKHLLETQQHDEAKKHLETCMSYCAKMSGGQQPVVAPMDDKHLSALAENVEKLQNQFEDLIRLAGPALEITQSELDGE